MYQNCNLALTSLNATLFWAISGGRSWKMCTLRFQKNSSPFSRDSRSISCLTWSWCARTIISRGGRLGSLGARLRWALWQTGNWCGCFGIPKVSLKKSSINAVTLGPSVSSGMPITHRFWWRLRASRSSSLSDRLAYSLASLAHRLSKFNALESTSLNEFSTSVRRPPKDSKVDCRVLIEVWVSSLKSYHVS